MSHVTRNILHTLPNYRPYIDGLRAFAVLSVVGFHAFPRWIGGGFIGVDIFFVISGFLISTILFEGLENHSFSLSDFYVRRIRRIFPALLLVLVSCFAFGWFTLMPDEYLLLGKHLAGGAGFVSNFIFWNEAGYFDKVAETKPLLHLWSLGIEEQFYIVWPLLLWATYKYRFNLLTITVVIAIASFVLNMHEVKTDAIAAFYSPLTRFWELLCGSILAWLTLHPTTTFSALGIKLNSYLNRLIYRDASKDRGHTLSNVQSILGFLLICYGLYRITRDSHFPGSWALIPVAGAVLILSAGSNAWLNRTVLSSKLLVWLGLISYPLYLWHWALLSFARILEGDVPSRNMRLMLVAASVVLAWLTYQLIEKPFRFGKHGKAKTITLLMLMIIVGYVGYNTFQSGGLAFRTEMTRQAYKLSTAINTKPNEECLNFHEGVEFFENHKCEVSATSPEKRKVILYGDSHAWGLSPRLMEYFTSQGDQFKEYLTAYCVPYDLDNKNERCRKINHYIFDKIAKQKPDLLIIFAYYSFRASESEYQGKESYDQHIKNIAQNFLRGGVKKVLIVGPMPVWNADLPKILQREFLMKRLPFPERTTIGLKQESLDFDSKMKNYTYPNGVEYVSLNEFLCDEKGCLVSTGPNVSDHLMVWDYGHLTVHGANFIFNNLLKAHLL